MAHKSQIAWRRVSPDGQHWQVYAYLAGRRWIFFIRQRRYERWQTLADPLLEDWLALLESIRRRAARRLFPPDEVRRVESAIRERFPEAEL